MCNGGLIRRTVGAVAAEGQRHTSNLSQGRVLVRVARHTAELVDVRMDVLELEPGWNRRGSKWFRENAQCPMG